MRMPFVTPDPSGRSVAGVLGYGDDERQDQLGNQIAQPHSGWLRQADAADGHEPANAGKQDTESEQVNQRALLSDSDPGP